MKELSSVYHISYDWNKFYLSWELDTRDSWDSCMMSSTAGSVFSVLAVFFFSDFFLVTLTLIPTGGLAFFCVSFFRVLFSLIACMLSTAVCSLNCWSHIWYKQHFQILFCCQNVECAFLIILNVTKSFMIHKIKTNRYNLSKT